MSRYSDVLKRLPRPMGSGGRYLFLLSLFGFSALFLAAFVSREVIDNPVAPYLIASMGAATVLMFAAPDSPMATPWAFVAGNLLSAVVGVGCVKLFGDAIWVAPLAVSSAILLMHLARCQHPPGGATALFAVIGGEPIHQLGFSYLLHPVGWNVLIFGAVVMAYRHVLSAIKQREQAQQHLATRLQPVVSESSNSELFSSDDVQQAIEQTGLLLDISESQLQELMQRTLLNARLRQQQLTLCGDRMQADVPTVVFGDSLYHCWQQMQSFGGDYVVVIDKGRFVQGVVWLADILALLDLQQNKPLYGQIRKGLKPSGELESDRPEVAGQLMQPLVQVQPQEKLLDHWADDTAPLLAVVDERSRLAGVIDCRLDNIF